MMSLGLFGLWRAQKVIPDKEAQQSGFLLGVFCFWNMNLGSHGLCKGKYQDR